MARTVLVADDSVASQRLFEMVLTREGFDVVTVGSGPDVLNQVRAKHPDLALIDAVMPGVDGYQLCQALKKDPQFKNLPIIMLAGAYEDVDRQRGASIVGAQAILDKPATSQVIIAKVKEFLAAQPAPAKAKAGAPVKAKAAAPVKAAAAAVVQEPSFVEAEEYEFDDNSEEVDLAVESELLEEEAEWEETDADVEAFDDVPDGEDIGELEPDAAIDDIDALEDIETLAEDDVFADIAAPPQDVVAPPAQAPAAPHTLAMSGAQLDAVAEDIAQRVAAKLGPVLLQSLTAYVLQLPAVRHIVEDASKSLVQEILPEIRNSAE